jgi:transposase
MLLANQGHRGPAIAQQLQRTAVTVRTWLKRFNAAGLAALTDKQRTGRPAAYTPPHVAAVIATALTPPEHLGLPFASWTLDRLAAYVHEHKAMAIKRSRIDDLLIAEGLRWRTHATWGGERVDPEFAKKRGAWRNSLRTRLKVVSCSAGITWALHRPRASPVSHACARPLPPRNRPLPSVPVKRSMMGDAVRATSLEHCVL